MADSLIQDEARKWVDSLGDKWRLQILSKRFRINPGTGMKTELPTRVRRFVEGCPWSLVDAALRYLLSQAPYKGVIYNGVPLEGEYRPTLTTWKRDDQDLVVSPTATRHNDGTYTLVQDLIEAGAADALSTLSSDSCSEEVLTDWRWDADSVEPLPTSSEQGVSYAITSVSRNEDGTFNYALVRRTSKPRVGGWSVKRDTATERVEVLHADNLRGSPNAWEGVSIPDGGPGVTVDVDYQQNDDCTYRVTVTVTTAKDAETGTEDRKDQFRNQHAERSSGQTSPLGDAPEPSGGVVVKHTSEMQPDGSYRTERTTETEKPVPASVVEVRRGRKGTRQTVTDTNQEAPASLSPDVGGSVRVEKTPGKRYNNTVVTWLKSAAEKVASVCKFDIFSHTHSVTTSGGSAIPDGDVPPAANGVVHTRRADMDDEGAITQTDETETEQPVPNAVVKYMVGLRGVRKSLTHRNVASAPSAPAFSRANIGKSVTVEKTPGGLNNVTEEEIDKSGTGLDTGETCEKTVFEHSHTKSRSEPDGTPGLGHVSDAGGGHYHRSSTELDESGAVVRRDTDVDEVQHDDAEVEIRRTAKAVITRKTTRNTLQVARTPSNIGETQSHTTNPGGSRNLTVTQLELTAKSDRAHCETTVFEHVHDKVVTAKGDAPDDSDAPAAGAGHTYRKESVVDETGVITTTTRDTEEKPVEKAEVSYRRTLRGLVTTTVDRNQGGMVTAPGDGEVGVTNSSKMTPGGKYDNTTQTKTASAKPDSSAAEEDAFHKAEDVVTLKTAGVDNPPMPPATGVGGTYGRTTEDMDQDGFVKVVKRTVREKQQDNGANGASNLRYTETTTSKRNNPSPAFPKVASAGRTYQWTSRKTEGGNYDTVETERVATPCRQIKVSYSGSFLAYVQISFYNASASDVQSACESCARDFDGLVGRQNEKWPSGFGMHCTASLNEFGLFDGQVSGTATYGPYQNGSGNFGELKISSSTIHLQPIWDWDAIRLKGVVVETAKYEVTSKYGWGLSGLRYESPSSGDVLSTRAEYSPLTNVWALTYSELKSHSVKFVDAGDNGTVDIFRASTDGGN